MASRFVQRLAAVAGESRWKAAIARGDAYLGYARALDTPAAVRPVARPKPRPPLEARPKQLSVTESEHWLRDPYTIYAKHVLDLQPLDDIDTPPGAADRGTLIHDSIGEFAKTYPQQMPDDPVAVIREIGERHFKPLASFPEARAFWWPRFVRIARWFVAWETTRRANTVALHAETKGRLEIPAGDRVFTLTTRADRIERLRDGTFAILDYKTGATPTARQVSAGLSPQLTLEGAILAAGQFEGIEQGTLSTFAYVSLRGRDPAGEERPIVFDDGPAGYQADKALTRLKRVIARFEEVETPYRALVSPMWKTRYGDYDHLARVMEWSAGGEDEEMGE